METFTTALALFAGLVSLASVIFAVATKVRADELEERLDRLNERVFGKPKEYSTFFGLRIFGEPAPLSEEIDELRKKQRLIEDFLEIEYVDHRHEEDRYVVKEKKD